MVYHDTSNIVSSGTSVQVCTDKDVFSMEQIVSNSEVMSLSPYKLKRRFDLDEMKSSFLMNIAIK